MVVAIFHVPMPPRYAYVAQFAEHPRLIAAAAARIQPPYDEQGLHRHDWMRAWRTAGVMRWKPLISGPDLNVDCDAGGKVVLPSARAPWGDPSVTEFVQVIPYDSSEPGMAEQTTFAQFQRASRTTPHRARPGWTSRPARAMPGGLTSSSMATNPMTRRRSLCDFPSIAAHESRSAFFRPSQPTATATTFMRSARSAS